MAVLVLVDGVRLFHLVPIPAHHGCFERRATGVEQERRVTVHLPHEVVIDCVDPRRDAVRARRHHFEPLSFDDVHRAALVCLCALHTRRIAYDHHGGTGEPLVDHRFQHRPYEPLDAHVEANRLTEYERPPTRVLLSDHCGWRQPKVETDQDRPVPIQERTQRLRRHVVVRAEVLVHRGPGAGQPILPVDENPDILVRPPLRVVVPVGQVLDVLSARATPRRLLEHIPAVVVGADPILRLDLLHLVVPPTVHRWRVGITPHPMPRRTAVLGRGESPDTFGHGVHDVRVDISALVEPREGKFQ